jgi:D-alanyl-D-alanine carboxypeptidase
LPFPVPDEKHAQNGGTPIFFAPEKLANIPVTAKAYIVYDVTDKRVIVAKNEQQVLPLASVSKVMTALTAHRMADLDTRVTVGKDAKLDGGYGLGLKENQSWRLDELLKYSLIFSSNSGMYAVASHFGIQSFIARMNVEASKIGSTLQFTNPAGLDLKGQVGGVGSAYDVALMMTQARKEIPQLLDATTHRRITVRTEKESLSGIPNTNQDIVAITGAEGSKTGYTDLAGGNLALVFDVALGHPMVLVVLGSTRTDRFTDAETIYKALLASMK